VSWTCCPPPAPCPGAPFPPRGARAQVSPLPRYYGALRLPGARPASLPLGGCSAVTLPRACVRLSVQARRRPGARGVGVRPPPGRSLSRRRARASQVPGRPWCAYAVFSDPGGSASPVANGEGAAAPPSGNSEGSPRVWQSRGSIARPEHWLSTLRRDRYQPRRKTRFRLLARLYRVGLATHRAATKGFRDAVLHRFPLSRASLVAMPACQAVKPLGGCTSARWPPEVYSRSVVCPATLGASLAPLGA
jgi:hypothetical protein